MQIILEALSQETLDKLTEAITAGTCSDSPEGERMEDLALRMADSLSERELDESMTEPGASFIFSDSVHGRGRFTGRELEFPLLEMIEEWVTNNERLFV